MDTLPTKSLSQRLPSFVPLSSLASCAFLIWILFRFMRGDDALSRLQGDNINTVTSLAFSPDGTRLAIGGLDGVVEIWDVSDASALR